MGTFIAVFIILLLVVAGMGVGIMFGRGPLKGSCGGMGSAGIEGNCDICGNDPAKCEESPAEMNGNGSTRV